IDGDGDALTVTQVNGSGANVGSLFTLPSDANLTVGALGDFIYDPNGAFDYLAAGQVATDSFTYQVDDGNGGTDTATVTLRITGTADAPTSNNVGATGDEDDASITITLTGSDVDGSIDFYQLTSLPANGTLYTDATLLIPAATGSDYAATAEALSLYFVPNLDWNGVTSFQFAAKDNSGLLDATPATATTTVDAVNDAPVITIVEVTGSITEGATLSDAGSITFTDVDVSDTPTATEVTKSVTTALTLTAAQQTAIEDAFTISPDAGNTNNGTINWDYTITEAELDFLADGETVTVVYTIIVGDANGGTDTQDVTVTITGANDTPIIAVVDVAGAITEGTTLTDSGSITFTDVDLTDTPTATEATKSVTTALTLTVAQQTAIEDAFTISPDAGNTNNGTINWDYTITEGELDFLAVGETVTVVYTITVNDANGGTDTQDVTITITGANDAPVIAVVDVTGAITEGTTLTDSGSIIFSDLDLTDTPTATEVTKSVTTALTLTAAQQAAIEDAFIISPDAGNTNNGTINWDYTITEAELDFLAAGETVTVVYTITVNDANGGTDTQDMTITITGANDVPVIAAVDVAGSITEGTTLSDAGSITFTDLDLTDTPTATEVTKSVTTALTLTAAQQTAIEDAFIISPDAGNTNNGTISWDYTITEAELDFLAAGETVAMVYTITVDDGNSGTDTQDVTITITGTNDAPVIAIIDVTGSINEGATLTDSGSITFTDLDLTDLPTATEVTKSVTTALTLTAAQQAAIENAFTISATGGNTNNGTINWDYTITEAALDFLAAGETVTVVFTITVDDANGGTDTQDVTVTITGANDAPVIAIVDVAGSITEGATLTDSGSITFTDLDLTDTPTATEVTKSVTTALALTAAQQTAIEDAFIIIPDAGNTNNGTISWDYTITEAALDFLAAGETVTVVYTITVDDANGSTDTQDVTVTITGANDAPVIAVVDVTGVITEGATLTDSGSITFTDLDLTDTPTASEATKSITTALTLTAAQQAAIENAFTISADAGNTNNGTINWDYTITEAELDFLAAGETVTVIFTIMVDDGSGGTDGQDVTVTITGANDAPVIAIGDVTGNITEGSTLTDSGSITFTDLDLTDTLTATEVTKSLTTALTLTAAQQAAIENAFTISAAGGNTNNGTINWDYTITEAELDFLAAGETVTAVFTITINDANGGTDTQDVTVTINGANDTPVIAVVDVAGSITEGTTLSDAGSITFTDLDLTDTPTATEVTKSVTTALTLTAAQQTAIEDAFTLSPDAGNTNNGTINWDYTITEAELDFLAAGETVTVVYTITVDDANGGTDTQDVTVTITGANDAPIIAIVDVAGAITEGSTLSDAGSITFTDLDLTDTPTASEATKSITTALTLSAAQQAAIENAFSISAAAGNTNNGTINWDYIITEAELDFLAAGETVTVVFTITIDDGNGGTDSQDVTITITGSNDAPVIAVVDVAGSITEGSTLNDAGSITFTDLDLTDTPTVSEITKSVTTALTLTAAQQAAIEDAFSISAAAGNANNGTINWDYTITGAELDFLAAGETVTVVYTITVDDANGGTDIQDVTVTITGSNDASVIAVVDVAGSITEGITLSDAGSITFTDLDLTDTPTATEVTKSVTTALTLTAAQQTAIEDAFTISA
ncbi:MAG: VCBS domain-containing protein, partial [Gammaproteobacteria bacterium]